MVCYNYLSGMEYNPVTFYLKYKLYYMITELHSMNIPGQYISILYRNKHQLFITENRVDAERKYMAKYNELWSSQLYTQYFLARFFRVTDRAIN
jgi:hypothetical protein